MNQDLLKAGLISQSGECIVLLSRYLLTLNEGDRILPKGELAKRYHIGVGTVQTAFKTLESTNAAHINSRGHLGSFVTFMDRDLLWQYSLYGYVRGTMPLPYHDILVGLATGINNIFNQNSGIMVRMSYVRGSRARIENVSEGLDDFTICSLFAAKYAVAHGKDVHLFKSFSDNTYIGQTVLLVRKGISLGDGITVGIDSASFDQDKLTKELFKDMDVNYKTVQYNNFHDMLNSRQIDACVWSEEDVRGFDGEIVHLPGKMAETINDAGRAAIVVSNQSRDKMKSVEDRFDIEKIEKIQRDIIEKKEIPNY